MPAISPNQSKRQTRAIDQWITEGQTNSETAVKAFEAALAHPCAPHVWNLEDLWNGLADAHADLGHADEAAAARARSAEAAGGDANVACHHCGHVATS